MLNEKRLSALIGHIYDAMLEESAWRTCLSEFAQTVNGTLPMLFIHDSRALTGAVVINVGYDEEVLAEFHEYYQARNVWLRGAAQKGLLDSGRVRTSHMACSRRDFLRSEFFAGWCKPLGVTQAIGSTILKDDASMFNLTILGGAGVVFGDEEVRVFETLMPHLQRALKVYVRFAEVEKRQRELTEIVDGLSIGVMLVTSTSRVLHANREAERMIRCADGLGVDALGLRAASDRETVALRRLIGAAAETSAGRGLHSGGVLSITRPSGRRSFEVLVSPLRVSASLPLFRQPVVLLFVSDPESVPRTSKRVLQNLYGLTGAECRVASLVACGMTVKDISEALEVSRNTVKTQLKSIFAKTDTRRQTELVKLILDGIANVDAVAASRECHGEGRARGERRRGPKGRRRVVGRQGVRGGAVR
jgi:DNA-binding CsgD family transcriptional regulator